MKTPFMVILVDKKVKRPAETLAEARAIAEELFKAEIGQTKEEFLVKATLQLGMFQEEAEADFRNVLMDAGIYLAEYSESEDKYFINRGLY